VRIIVTGPSGFIGRGLCRRLLERGHEVIGLSRKSFYPEGAGLGFYRHVPYNMGDVLPLELKTFSPEAIVHLAWDGIPDFSERRCVQNLESQISFFNQIKDLQFLNKVIGAGTCREYGFNQGACFEGDTKNPDDFFSWVKRALSGYISLLCKQKKIEFVWFRIFYVYGPGQRSEALIPMLIRANLSGVQPDIKNPTAANDYVYIDDVVSAFVMAIEGRALSGTFNLGSGVATTTTKIAKIVALTMQNDEQVSAKTVAEVSDFMGNTGMWADISSIADELNWMPQVSLCEGIKQTIGYRAEW